MRSAIFNSPILRHLQAMVDSRANPANIAALQDFAGRRSFRQSSNIRRDPSCLIAGQWLFVRENRYWVVCYRGQVQLPHTKRVDARCNNHELIVFDPQPTIDVFRRVVVHHISPVHPTDKTLGPIKISIFSVTIDAEVEREFPTCLGTGTSQRFVLGGACLYYAQTTADNDAP